MGTVPRRHISAMNSLWEASKRSPFLTVAQCESKVSSENQLVANRNIAAASADVEPVAFGSGKYYAFCGLGGLISCGLTHTLIVPLDLVKCRIQTNTVVSKMNQIKG